MKLKSGYTTGTCACAVFVSSLDFYLNKHYSKHVYIKLPQDEIAKIEVKCEGDSYFSTIKGDNDDMDVTKGAIISCKILSKEPINIKEQTPSLIEVDKLKIYIYAGNGVGVVTKKGLKIKPNYPAINPTPLDMMYKNIINFSNHEATLYALFCVKDGELIAKETANSKVGVIGGISILGTKGIVKPVSSLAYIQSIETEINVSYEFDKNVVVFTLGNSALDFAKQDYVDTSIIEIGNFIYDSLVLLKKFRFKKIVFITSVAKMSKVAQEFKNTHNRYGSIDFTIIKDWLNILDIDITDDEFVTLKAVLETLDRDDKGIFIEFITKKAFDVIKRWLNILRVDSDELEIIVLPQKIKIKDDIW